MMMLVAILLCVTLLILLLCALHNPLVKIGETLTNAARVNVGPYIRVFERDGDRLFVVEPEQVVIYNTAGALYYYFEGGASKRLCPYREQAIVRVTSSDVRLINETGTYNISCTATNSSNLYNHFKTDSVQHQVPVFIDSVSVLDIINYLISEGFAKIK